MPMPECFRDAQQCAGACRALLAIDGLSRLWTDQGPTEEARSFIHMDRSSMPLSVGERALLLTAWSLWTGEPTSLRFDELLGLEEAEPICKLTIAALYGPQAIDVWLTRSDAMEGYASSPAEMRALAAVLFDEARASFAEGGGEAMNLRAAPDACALGALRLASYALIDGLEPIENDEERHEAAMLLTLHVLGFSAAIESELADEIDEVNEAGLNPSAEERSGC